LITYFLLKSAIAETLSFDPQRQSKKIALTGGFDYSNAVTRRIFIASSTERKNIASQLADQLSKSGYAPFRWWDPTSFPLGSFTLEALLDLTREVDGAIFIFSPDDRVWYRETAVETPRDNVVFEYGLFVSILGRDRCIIASNKGVKLPTDILAITRQDLFSGDLTAVSNDIIRHYKRKFDRSEALTSNSATIVADVDLADKQLRIWPDEWHQRDLYLGIQGARAWMAVVRGSKYVSNEHRQSLKENLTLGIEPISVRTFVSLGPGDAETDRDLALQLQNNEALLEYVPVDIGIGLLKRSIKEVGKSVQVPFGIFSDFEAGIDFVHAQLRKRAAHPFLFALLGNTIGNIDSGERFLLTALRNKMATEDHLLLDAVIKGPKWEFDKDRRATYENYDENFRFFVAQGVARRTGESISELVRDFEQKIVFRKGSSDVPGTETVNITYLSSGRLIQAHRRYDPELLTKWVEKLGFIVDFNRSYLLQGDERKRDEIGHIVLRLRRAQKMSEE
jgi:predicted nucleotide-binding protein